PSFPDHAPPYPHPHSSPTRRSSDLGSVVLIDFMPVASEEQKRRALWPEHELVRRVECEAGEADVHVHFNPRPDFGRVGIVIRDVDRKSTRLNSSHEWDSYAVVCLQK